MREIINYAEITCDFCGKVAHVEHIKTSQVLPEGWRKAEIPQLGYSFNNKYDLCPKCIKKLENVIKYLKNNLKSVPNSIDEFVIQYNKTSLLERPTAFEVSLLYPEYVFLFNQDTNDIEEYWYFYK